MHTGLPRTSGVHVAYAALDSLAILIAGVLAGLGFFIGAMSPALAAILSKYEANLNRFAPATTPELRDIVSNFGKIVFKGMGVGVILCTPLLFLAAQHRFLPLRAVVLGTIVPPWTVVLVVFGLVHHYFSIMIRRSKDAARSHLRHISDSIYTNIKNADRDEFNRLKELIELDKAVQSSNAYAIDLHVIWQTMYSLLLPLLPVAAKVLLHA